MPWYGLCAALRRTFNRKAERTQPAPRLLPKIGGFSSLFVELRDGALRLREDLDAAHSVMQADLSTSPPSDLPPSVWDVKLYSTSVTIFAAAAIEAALNQYGLMRFGEEQFERHFAYAGPVKRLRRLAKFARGLDLADNDPLVAAVARLSQRRNELLHPRAVESTVDSQGVFRTPDAAWNTPTKRVHADESIKDMEIFFSLFPQLDPETAMFLRPWSVRYR